MGLVTGGAVAISIRFVGLFIFFGQFCVAGKAAICQICIDQPLFTAGMGSMAGAAVSFGYRSVNNTHGKFFFALFVTGVTEFAFMVTQ